MKGRYVGSESGSNNTTSNRNCIIEDILVDIDKMVHPYVNKMKNSITEDDIESDTDSHISDPKISNIIDIVKRLTNSTTKKGDIKIFSMRILLTYQDVKLNKIALFEYISNLMRGKNKIIKDYIITHEKSEEQCTYHTHMYFKLNESFRSSNSKMFNFRGIQPNVERVFHYADKLERVYLYLLRQDTEPYTNVKERIKQIKSTRRGIEDIPQINTISHINNTFHINNTSVTELNVTTPTFENNIVNPIDPWEFKPWQRFLLNVVEDGVDNRAFYWCWEPNGQMGKQN